MHLEESSHKKVIRHVIQQINNLWMNKKYNEMSDLLSEDVVIALPGFEGRIQGKKAYIQSYRDYDKSAITHEFSSSEPDIDIMGDTAVAIYTFYVRYELNGKSYRENGRDLLVFSLSSGKWCVVWRTVLSESTK